MTSREYWVASLYRGRRGAAKTRMGKEMLCVISTSIMSVIFVDYFICSSMIITGRFSFVAEALV